MVEYQATNENETGLIASDRELYTIVGEQDGADVLILAEDADAWVGSTDFVDVYEHA